MKSCITSIAAVAIYLLTGTLLSGCKEINVPPAETPELISSGISVSGRTGNAAIGRLKAYCNDYTAPMGASTWGGRGFYITLKVPPLNELELRYGSVNAEFWGSYTSAEDQALTQGPRPVNQSQIQQLRGNYVAYFIHDDELSQNEYRVTLGVLLGAQTPSQARLSITAYNQDPDNTGLAARSNPLEISITEPVALTADAVPKTLKEFETLTISWESENAGRVEIIGDGFSESGPRRAAGGVESGSVGCIGDTDSQFKTYVVRALRDGCPSPKEEVVAIPIMVQSSRTIEQFEALPNRPYEKSTFNLAWHAPGASGVSITGPNNYSYSGSSERGQTSVTAPEVPKCAGMANFEYSLTANYPGSCGSRNDTTLVSIIAAGIRTYTFEESGGPRCQSSNQAAAQGRSVDEAKSCLRASIQTGCSWKHIATR